MRYILLILFLGVLVNSCTQEDYEPRPFIKVLYKFSKEEYKETFKGKYWVDFKPEDARHIRILNIKMYRDTVYLQSQHYYQWLKDDADIRDNAMRSFYISTEWIDENPDCFNVWSPFRPPLRPPPL